MANPTIIQPAPAGLSDYLSSYDEAHWEVQVCELKPNTGTLLRGSVLSAIVADAGKLTLTAAGSEDLAYGILLDEAVDTTQAYSDASVTGSVARAGSFRGPALRVATGTDVAKVTARLRDQGIYTHGPITAPV
jgi:hypothetical protein